MPGGTVSARPGAGVARRLWLRPPVLPAKMMRPPQPKGTAPMEPIARRLCLVLAAALMLAASLPAFAADEAMPARGGAAGESMRPRPGTGGDDEMSGTAVRPRPAANSRTTPAAGTATKANAPTGAPAGATTAAKAPPVKWHNNWTPAAAEARKGGKMILMYFSSSDYDDFSKKLQREVLGTPMFIEWAQKNVVLFQVDFPQTKKVTGSLKAQNDRFKQKYNITHVPTFVFMDADGEPYVRAGYDTAKLRDDEKKGAPLKWIAFADNVVKSKPGQEALRVQKSFAEGSAYARKTGLPFLLLITKAKTDPRVVEANKAVINSQKFIRFVNRTMIFMPWDWPDDADTSPDAAAFRKFAQTYSIGEAPAQFVMFFPSRNSVKLKVTAFSPSKVEALRKQLENQLPTFDYGGAWTTSTSPRRSRRSSSGNCSSRSRAWTAATGARRSTPRSGGTPSSATTPASTSCSAGWTSPRTPRSPPTPPSATAASPRCTACGYPTMVCSTATASASTTRNTRRAARARS